MKLPEDFFDCFSNLRWLDLRHNRLTNIPSFYLKDMVHLQTLLLEGNNLSSLPLELGELYTFRVMFIARH